MEKNAWDSRIESIVCSVHTACPGATRIVRSCMPFSRIWIWSCKRKRGASHSGPASPRLLLRKQGSIFWSENYMYSSPLLKMIFFPSHDISFSNSYRSLSLILPYFAFILCFHFPFFFTISSFFFPLSSFLFNIFPIFLFLLTNFFLPNDIGWYWTRGGGGGGFF